MMLQERFDLPVECYVVAARFVQERSASITLEIDRCMKVGFDACVAIVTLHAFGTLYSRH